MRKFRRCLLLVCAILFPALALAQTFPNRSVRLIIPYAVGGSMDVVGHALAKQFQEITGQSMIVINHGGVAGLIGAEYVVRSPADGYTLLLGTAAQTTIAQAYLKSMPYAPLTDLEPVSEMINTPNVVFVSTTLPVKTLQDLIAYARTSAHPVTYGSSGLGSVTHLATALLAQRAGVTMTHVPYSGAAPALNDLAAGRIDLELTFLASASSLLDLGKIRALAIAGPKRLAALPGVPTTAEAGVKGADSGVWIGLFAPKGTPKDVVNRLNAIVQKALASPEVTKQFAALDTQIDAQGPQAFKAMLSQDAQTWKDVVKAGHIAQQ